MIKTIRVWRDTKYRDEAIKLAVDTFGSVEKAEIWMRASLPLLGGFTPLELISDGRSKKLLAFMKRLQTP